MTRIRLWLLTHLYDPDISIPEDVRSLFENAVEAFGRVDILFNNAGWEGPSHDILDYSADDLTKIYNTNIVGMIFAMQHAAKLMIEGEGDSKAKQL